MKQHRSFTERYIQALNEFNSSDGKSDIETIKELHQAAELLEEYSLLNISSLCDHEIVRVRVELWAYRLLQRQGRSILFNPFKVNPNVL